MTLKKIRDSHGNYYELKNLNTSLMTIFIHGVGLDNTMWFPQKEYFNDTATTEIYTILFVGSVRCV